MSFELQFSGLSPANDKITDKVHVEIAGDENAGALFELIVNSYDTDKDAPTAKDIKALKLSAADLKAAHEQLESVGVVKVDKAYRFNGRVLYDRIKSLYHCGGYRQEQALIQFLASLPQV
jgi:hypothetical protein